VLRWDRAVLAVALAAIAVATNPDQAHFVNFVKEYTQRGLGFLPGDSCLQTWTPLAGPGGRGEHYPVCSMHAQLSGGVAFENEQAGMWIRAVTEA
jgi:hypothetical protein